MAMQTIDAAATRGFPSIKEFGNRILQAVRHWLLADRTRRELSALSDIDLADIGLTRCDIDYVAMSTTDWHFERGRKADNSAQA